MQDFIQLCYSTYYYTYTDILIRNTLKAMLHEAIFLATCNATNVALEVARKNSRVTPHFATAIVALRVGRKVERPSTFRNVARQVTCVCSLKGFLFVIVPLQVARKIASCNMAFTAGSRVKLACLN